MAQFGFLYDQTRCIGCNACQIACKDQNNLENGMVFRRVVTVEDHGFMHYSGACNHCKDAACVKACPTGAMHYREDGTVGHDREKCIGCGTCTWACPYGAPKLSHKYGTAMKCTSCYPRRKEGKQPFCVEACVTHCLEFRDLDALTPEEEKGLVRELDILPEASKTQPSLRIRKKKQEICYE